MPKIEQSTFIFRKMASFLQEKMLDCNTFYCALSGPGESHKAELVGLILRTLLLKNKSAVNNCKTRRQATVPHEKQKTCDLKPIEIIVTYAIVTTFF